MFVFGNTAKKLERAIRNGDVNAARKIIAAKKELLDGVYSNGSILSIACNNHYMVGMLLDMGADPLAKVKSVYSTLYKIVSYDTVNQKSLALMTKKALQQNEAQTIEVFMRAIRGFECRNVETMLEAGVSVNAKGRDGVTPLVHAILHGNSATFDLLLEKGTDPHQKNDKLRTPLMQAVLANQPLMVRKLLECGARVDEKDSENKTALSMLSYKPVSAGSNTKSIPFMLMERGADISVLDSAGENALMKICYEYDEPETIDLFLAKGGKLDDKNNDGKTALMIAVKRGNKSMAEHLLSRGARHDINDADGNNLLMIALQNDRENIAVALIKKNLFDLTARNHKGNTVFHLAKDNNCRKVLRIIQELEKKSAHEESGTKRWVLSGTKIAYIDPCPELKLTLTTIFNFETRESLVRAQNTDTKAESISTPRSFDEIDQEQLKKAFDAFIKEGGSADEGYVFTGAKSLNKKLGNP